MLGKLIKYEFKATGRTILPLYGGLLVFALILRIIYRNFDIPNNNFSKLAIGLSIFIYGFIMATVFVATFFIIVQRFHKNLLGDEGYLMHTLPVMPYKNIISKLVTSGVWSIVSCVIALLSIFILVIEKKDINILFSNIIPAIKSLFSDSNSEVYLIFFESIILCLSSLILFILKLYSSISIGHLFNKSKILLSVVAFIVITTLEGFITSGLFVTTIDIFNSSNFSYTLIICIIINFIYSLLYFFITNYILKNKLNLE